MSKASDSWPPPLSPSKVGSFAYETMRERVPSIIVKVINATLRQASRSKSDHLNVEANCKRVISHLSRLRYELTTDKLLKPIEDNGEGDAGHWNDHLQRMAKCTQLGPTRPFDYESDEVRFDPDGKPLLSWFTTTWLFAECYAYRRILEAFHQSQVFNSFDPFKDAKIEAWNTAEESSIKLLSKYESICRSEKSEQELKQILGDLIQVSTWGNRCDLSLTACQSVESNSSISSLGQHDTEHLLCDQSDEIIDWLLAPKNSQRRLDFVADNAGFELLADVVLIHFLRLHGLIDRVELHLKRWPWFVSDSTDEDLFWLLAKLKGINFQSLASDLEKYMDDGSIQVRQDLVWNQADTYYELTEYPLFVEMLKDSYLILLKGDLNYRRLIGDAEWNEELSPQFAEVKKASFPEGPAMCVFRTIKSDTCSWLCPEAVSRARQLSDSTDDWLINGKFAVIQFSK